MTTALPPSSDFTGAAITEGDFKSAITALRDYLSGLFGTDGAISTALATLGAPISGYSAKTTTYSVVAADKGKLINATTGTWTLSLLAAATAADGFNVTVRNSGTGVITVDPNLTETIDGSSTLAVNAGESVLLYCDGTAWYSIGKSSGVPSGAWFPYSGTSAPAGYLLCDGSAVSRSTYASLFTAIGTVHGVGDGSTTFNLPDMRGRLPVGQDDMGGSAASRVTTAGSGVDGATLGATGGAQNVTLTAAESGLPSHTHAIYIAGGGGTGSDARADFSVSTGFVGASGVVQSSGSSSASSAHNNMPPSLVANYIIKT